MLASVSMSKKQNDPEFNTIHQLLLQFRAEALARSRHLESLIANLNQENKALRENIEALETKFSRKQPEDSFKTKILFKGKNLLDVHTSSSSKYVTKLMEILFTKEELHVGYIKAEKSTSKREDLDNERVEILKGMQNII